MKYPLINTYHPFIDGVFHEINQWSRGIPHDPQPPEMTIRWMADGLDLAESRHEVADRADERGGGDQGAEGDDNTFRRPSMQDEWCWIMVIFMVILRLMVILMGKKNAESWWIMVINDESWWWMAVNVVVNLVAKKSGSGWLVDHDLSSFFFAVDGRKPARNTMNIGIMVWFQPSTNWCTISSIYRITMYHLFLFSFAFVALLHLQTSICVKSRGIVAWLGSIHQLYINDIPNMHKACFSTCRLHVVFFSRKNTKPNGAVCSVNQDSKAKLDLEHCLLKSQHQLTNSATKTASKHIQYQAAICHFWYIGRQGWARSHSELCEGPVEARQVLILHVAVLLGRQAGGARWPQRSGRLKVFEYGHHNHPWKNSADDRVCTIPTVLVRPKLETHVKNRLTIDV